MDTSDLLPSLAAGDLSETSGAELVAAIFRSRASGTLSLEGAADADIRVFFRAGDMCGCALFSGFRTLAQVLLEQDWVGALEIDSTWAESAAHGKRHGQVLVEKGLLTPDQLRTALGMQHRQNLGALLALTAGRYEWRGWEPPPPWTKEISTDPIGVLIQAFRSERLLPRRAAILGWLGAMPARLSVDWAGLSSRVVLEPVDREAVELLDRPRTLAQFAAEGGLEPQHAEALLATLLLTGCAEPHEGPAEEEDLPELDVLEEPAEAPRMVEAEAIDRLDRLDLDAPAAATGDEDEPLELAAAPAAPAARREDGGASDERAKALRRKMRARGLRNLGQGSAAEPDREDPRIQFGVDAPAGDGTAQTGQAPGAADQRFIDEVRSRLRLSGRQTAYEILSIAPTNSNDKIRTAYLDLVKRFHPDVAAAPGFAEVTDDLRALFDAIQQAYESIETATARAEYDRALKASQGKGAAPAKGAEAKTLVKMGEVLIKKRDFRGAIEKLRRAVELEPNGDTLAALAWGLLNDPSSSTALKEESAALIQKALRATGLTARTYYVAGVVWRTKDPESAIEAFRKALEADPHHPDAALELRLLEMRQNKSGKKAGGGVLAGLLFGKRKS
ncbi:MAG: hypothetical protein NVSMB23_10190 [Myxococcales bacterium]